MKLAPAFLQTLSAQVLQSAASFATGVLIARGLGPELQGRYAFVVATVATTVIVTSLGQFEGNVLSTGGSRGSGRVLLARALLQALVVLCLGGALLGPLERYLRGQASPQIVPLLLALITLETAAQLVRGINLGQHHVTAYNVATLVQRGVLLGGVVALTLARSLVLPRVLLSWGIATALSLAVSGVWIWWRSPAVTMSACHLLKGWQVSFARGFRALITITATFVLLRFDWWVLGPVLGSKAVGQISVATAIAEWLWYVPTILGSILFALVAADRSDAAVWKVARATRGVAAVVLPVAVILMLVGRYLVPAIYGDAYREAGRVLVVLAPGVAAIAVHLVADSYFAGSGFPLVSWAGALGALGVKVLLNALLVPIAGILGAAAATSTAYSCLLALKVWRLGRERGVSARDLLVLNRGDITYGLTAARAWVGERVHSA